MHKYPAVPKKCSLQHLNRNISKQNFKLSQNRHILYSTVCHLILCVKKWGSPSSFWRKRRFISLNSSAFIEKLSSSKGARACAHANHVKNHAQKGCTMQLNGITLSELSGSTGSYPIIMRYTVHSEDMFQSQNAN